MTNLYRVYICMAQYIISLISPQGRCFCSLCQPRFFREETAGRWVAPWASGSRQSIAFFLTIFSQFSEMSSQKNSPKHKLIRGEWWPYLFPVPRHYFSPVQIQMPSKWFEAFLESRIITMLLLSIHAGCSSLSGWLAVCLPWLPKPPTWEKKLLSVFSSLQISFYPMVWVYYILAPGPTLPATPCTPPVQLFHFIIFSLFGGSPLVDEKNTVAYSYKPHPIPPPRMVAATMRWWRPKSPQPRPANGPPRRSNTSSNSAAHIQT